MNIWILISAIWAIFLLFMIFAPKKWHSFVLKENTFWFDRNIITKLFLQKLVKFETSIWFKLLTMLVLLPMIYLAYLDV